LVNSTIYGSATPTDSAVTLCLGSSQVGIYTQLVASGNYCVQSTTSSISNAVVQNGGAPAIILCPSAGSGKTPVYAYKSATGDPATNSFGTNVAPPLGFNLSNGGNPVGYCYTTQQVQGVTLNPIYLASAAFNSGSSTATIMTYENAPVYGSVTYQRISNIPIGFGL
jgi:hypothetical protein